MPEEHRRQLLKKIQEVEEYRYVFQNNIEEI